MRIYRTLLICILLAGCAVTSPDERRIQSSAVAIDAGWQRVTLHTGLFDIAAFLPPNQVYDETLTVYIEGDGLAWINFSTPSFDPTPINPLALRLAILDTSRNAVYLARPCQYVVGVERHGCETRYWTSHRFSTEVIEASNVAVTQLKTRFSAHRIRFVGYSGGGAVAALIASKRDDVVQLVTVAGNLDHAVWTKQHHLSALSGSLNPVDVWRSLQEIPQRHYVGGKDTVIGERVAQSYVNRFPINKKPNVSVIPTFDHHCCWESIWPRLVESQFGEEQVSRGSVIHNRKHDE